MALFKFRIIIIIITSEVHVKNCSVSTQCRVCARYIITALASTILYNYVTYNGGVKLVIDCH